MCLDDVEAEIRTTEEYRERVIMVRSCTRRMIRNKELSPPAAPHRVSDANTNDSARSQRQTVKLPRLVIEKNNGEVSKWQDFWSQYETAIHNNDALCNREKFTYPILTYLTGPAARALAGR